MKMNLLSIIITVMLVMNIPICILIVWGPFPVSSVVDILIGLTCCYALLVEGVVFSGRKFRVITVPSQPLHTNLATDIPLYLISALVERKVTESAWRVVLLSFVQRGFIAVYPDRKKYVILYLTDDPSIDDPIEQHTWSLLQKQADANRELNILALERVRATFRGVVYPHIKAMLYQRGWFDRRSKEYSSRLGSVMIIGMLLYFPFIVTVSHTDSAAWGILCFLLVAALTLQLDATQRTLPETTADAEAIASPWRDFKRNIPYTDAYPDASRRMTLMDNLDRMLLYTVAVGNQFLPAEYYPVVAERDDRPSWMGPQLDGYDIANVWKRFLATLTFQSEGGA